MPMSKEAKKGLISSLMLECMAGGTPSQMVHAGKLVNLIRDYLTHEVTTGRPDFDFLNRIQRVLIHDIGAMVSILGDENARGVGGKIIETCFQGNFTIDKSWLNQETVTGISLFDAINTMEDCGSKFLSAQEYNALASSVGIPINTAVNAMKSRDQLLTIITNECMNACMDHDLIQFTGAQWGQAVLKDRERAAKQPTTA